MNYILLANVSFDFSGGDYNSQTVDNIYLAHGNFDSDEQAEQRAKELLTIYCADMYGAKEYDSDATAVQINLT